MEVTSDRSMRNTWLYLSVYDLTTIQVNNISLTMNIAHVVVTLLYVRRLQTCFNRRGVAWRGVAWRGVAWRGVAWRGVAWGGAGGLSGRSRLSVFSVAFGQVCH
jgi:hypothetical protein